MAYLNMDDGFPENPMIEALSDAEFRALTREICRWSQTGATDSDLVRELLATKMVRRAPRHWLPEWLQPAPKRYRKKIPIAARNRVYERDGFACRHCGSASALTLDHIVPWSVGGSDDEINLQTLCQPCNSRKGARV